MFALIGCASGARAQEGLVEVRDNPVLLPSSAIAVGGISTVREPATGVGPVEPARIPGLRWSAEVPCPGGRWALAGLQSLGRGEAFEEVALLVRARPTK